MANWLSNVNNLLTKLDDQVETAVEERVFAQDEFSSEGIDGSRTGIDGILAKRGLSSATSKDTLEEEDDANLGDEENIEENEKKVTRYQNDEKTAEKNECTNETKCTTNVHTEVSQSLDKNTTANLADENEINEIPISKEKDPCLQKNSNFHYLKENPVEIPTVNDLQETDTTIGDVTSKTEQIMDVQINQIPTTQLNVSSLSKNSMPSKTKDASSTSSSLASKISSMTTLQPPAMESSFDKDPTNQNPPTHSINRSKKEIRELAMERKEAQKEARTLRRHIVSLNDQLESAESELQAQRKELERAAEMMEKDRLKHEKEKGESLKRNCDEIRSLKTQHNESLKDQQARFEEQLERYRKRLSEEEKRRKQEGGDWDKEMSNANDREQNMRKTLNLLEDEKAVLLSQISTLQAQQTTLGSRLESLSQAADNAMQRERDAENRLDNTLNQYARQISHRQAREAQLEQTIQDLNAALVVSRSDSRTGINSSDRDESSGDYLHGKNHLEARISALELDLNTANSNLTIEKERSETLQIQLRSFSDETTQEATIVHAKEVQFGRQIADMTLTISKLEDKVRQYEKTLSNTPDIQAASVHDQKLPDQIKVLSEEVVRLRDKIANQNSESLAMKNRLKTAVDRSNKLEEDLQIAKMSSNIDPIAQSSSTAAFGGRRRNFGSSPNSSIRTAMLLNSSNGDRAEKIGQVVDQIDSFAASTGKYLRRNPLARAGFIFYLILIHLWTFVLLFFHAHSFDAITERDSISGVAPHGLHAIIQQQQQIKNNIVLH